MVELRVSRDLVADPRGHPALGRPENTDRLTRERNRGLAVLDGPRAYRVFMTIAEFPALQASHIRRMVGRASAQAGRIPEDLVGTGLMAGFEGRHYLDRGGMSRAATLSRVSAANRCRRHSAYLEQWYREHELLHNGGVNRLVVRFAQEGVTVVAGRRGEVNVPDVTRVRPDLLAPVVVGPLGGGFHFLEYERNTIVRRSQRKLGPYRRMARIGRALPALFVCDASETEEYFLANAGDLPLLTATLEHALAGPITGADTVWRSPAGETVELHCLRRNRR